jgi:hypothetical protein
MEAVYEVSILGLRGVEALAILMADLDGWIESPTGVPLCDAPQ